MDGGRAFFYNRDSIGQNKKGVVGMGLYLCKKLCHRLGHRIWAESEKGVYTEIFIEFGQDKHTEMA